MKKYGHLLIWATGLTGAAATLAGFVLPLMGHRWADVFALPGILVLVGGTMGVARFVWSRQTPELPVELPHTEDGI